MNHIIFGDIQPSPSPASDSFPSSQYHFVGMTSVTDFSYSPSEEEKSRNAAQIAATGRRNWKTLRGKGEAVWPPHLEAVLLEGLKRYDEEESRPTPSARFPRRNKFLSQYIFEHTGKLRTPKQVGSRLQQMRDTCKGSDILRLLLGRNKDSRDTEEPSEANMGVVADSRDLYSHGAPLARPVAGDHLIDSWVMLFPPPSLTTSLPPVIHLSAESFIGSPMILSMSPITNSAFSRLSDMSPILTLVSPYPLRLECKFSVFSHSGGTLIHEEEGRLTRDYRMLTGSESYQGTVYATTLVPGFWKALCNDSSPSNFSLVQRVEPAVEYGKQHHPKTTIGIHYRFSDRFDLGMSHGADFSMSSRQILSHAPAELDDQGYLLDRSELRSPSNHVSSTAHPAAYGLPQHGDYSGIPSISRRGRNQYEFDPADSHGHRSLSYY